MGETPTESTLALLTPDNTPATRDAKRIVRSATFARNVGTQCG